MEYSGIEKGIAALLLGAMLSQPTPLFSDSNRETLPARQSSPALSYTNPQPTLTLKSLQEKYQSPAVGILYSLYRSGNDSNTALELTEMALEYLDGGNDNIENSILRDHRIEEGHTTNYFKAFVKAMPKTIEEWEERFSHMQMNCSSKEYLEKEIKYICSAMGKGRLISDNELKNTMKNERYAIIGYVDESNAEYVITIGEMMKADYLTGCLFVFQEHVDRYLQGQDNIDKLGELIEHYPGLIEAMKKNNKHLLVRTFWFDLLPKAAFLDDDDFFDYGIAIVDKARACKNPVVIIVPRRHVHTVEKIFDKNGDDVITFMPIGPEDLSNPYISNHNALDSPISDFHITSDGLRQFKEK